MVRFSILIVNNDTLPGDPLISLGKRGYLGAGDGARTRDNLLGRQELYQLSYSRAGAEGET